MGRGGLGPAVLRVSSWLCARIPPGRAQGEHLWCQDRAPLTCWWPLLCRKGPRTSWFMHIRLLLYAPRAWLVHTGVPCALCAVSMVYPRKRRELQTIRTGAPPGSAPAPSRPRGPVHVCQRKQDPSEQHSPGPRVMEGGREVKLVSSENSLGGEGEGPAEGSVQGPLDPTPPQPGPNTTVQNRNWLGREGNPWSTKSQRLNKKIELKQVQVEISGLNLGTTNGRTLKSLGHPPWHHRTCRCLLTCTSLSVPPPQQNSF